MLHGLIAITFKNNFHLIVQVLYIQTLNTFLALTLPIELNGRNLFQVLDPLANTASQCSSSMKGNSVKEEGGF